MKILLGIVGVIILAQGSGLQAPSVSVEGVVLQFGSNEPIARVVVELRKEQAGSLPPALLNAPPPIPARTTVGVTSTGSATVTTNADGRFAFPNVPPGEYRLYATRETGYIPAEYGQRSPTGAGIPLIVKAGQSIAGIRLTMAPTGSISGRIIDRDGLAAASARVDLLRMAYREGGRVWVTAQVTLTNDRGEYRFYSLPPNKYYVSSQPWGIYSTRVGPDSEPTAFPNRFAAIQLSGAPTVIRRALESGETVEEVLRAVYYPGTPDSSAAQLVVLRAGENVGGINFSVAASSVPSRRVRGTVVDGESGKPAAGAIVRLVPRDQVPPVLWVPSAGADQTGRFEVQGAMSGSYSVFVSGNVSGYAVIDIGASDIEGLQIVAVKGGVDVPWRAAFDEGFDDPTAMARLRLTLTRDPDIIGPRAANSVATAGWAGVPEGRLTPQSVAAPGGFVLRNVSFGEYRLSVARLPQDAYVKSVRQGRTDILKDGIRIVGAVENPVEIVLGRSGGALTGHALNEKGEPASNVIVVLVPALNRPRTDLYRNTTTDSEGQFRFEGIAPDQYRLFAWEDVPPDAWYDQDFMRLHERGGVAVSVQPGGKGTADVQVIPWSDVQ